MYELRRQLALQIFVCIGDLWMLPKAVSEGDVGAVLTIAGDSVIVADLLP